MSGSDFAQLSARVAEAGLMRRRPGFYALVAGLTCALHVAGWVAFVRLGDTWAQLAVAVLLAVTTTQIAFLGHDVGHRQVFRTRRVAEPAGLLLGNLAIGLSYGWWMDKHTRHHANPNHEDEDPDVGEGVLIWSRDQAVRRRGPGARFVSRWQAYLFFPLLLLEGLNLHVESLRALVRTPMRHRRAEAYLLAAHTLGYLGVVAAVLPWPKALAFIAVHQGLWGLYMGLSFAPNHKGMPMPTADDRLDHLRRQVLTARNVRGGRLLDLAFGGLNHQIEHHLFPAMPRPHLRRARPIVRRYCAELGIPYHEAGLVDSYRQALTHLHDVGESLREEHARELARR